MSDFGFDAYAFGDEDARTQPHPLEIARDLIAGGKPRAALDVLSEHHRELADDPAYLLICSEAWWADGDTLRAQQALLGAARLAPDDPVPLQMLGELLEERGEHDKARRALEKARALEAVEADAWGAADGAPVDDDLIAFAERQERTIGAGLTAKQVASALVALALVIGLVAGIDRLTSDRVAAEPFAEPAPAVDAEPVEARRTVLELETGTKVALAPAPEPAAAPAAEPEPQRSEPGLPAESAVVLEDPVEAAPEAALPLKAAPAPRAPVAAAAKRRPKAKPRPTVSTPPAPEAGVVERELSSLDAVALTARADALFAQGHTAVAASYYRRALERDPDYAPALVGVGRGILRAEKYADAMKNATRALQLARGVDARPGLEAEAIYQMARVHLHADELDAARRLLRQSISLPGTPAAAWFYLGEASWSDNSAVAREAYERYLELVPEGSLADRARRAIQ